MEIKNDNNFDKKIVKNELICNLHSNNAIEFICTELNCLKELCEYCLLEHTQHFDNIILIKKFFKKEYEKYQTKIILKKNQNEFDYNELNKIEKDIIDIINIKFDNLKNKINQNHVLKKSLLNIKSKKINRLPLFDLFKLKDLFNRKFSLNYELKFDKNLINKKINKNIKNNINILKNNNNFETINLNINKYLHWFDWNKKKLNLFNLITNKLTVIKLIINFKIPSYSRSIMTPDGKIFLFGGEIVDYKIQKEVYYYDTNFLMGNLKYFTQMIVKKYDFSICYSNNYIYILGGKNETNIITNSCERLNLKNNNWEIIPKTKNYRFASSSICSANLKKIFLFGGRNQNNKLINTVEEFDILKNFWREIKIKNFESWIPVEISTGVQISNNKILIFGGNNDLINSEYSNSYIFDPIKYELNKIENLKLKHVFMVSPIKFGNYVYAIGNEYYIKNRNIHRFNIKKKKWDIIFNMN